MLRKEHLTNKGLLDILSIKARGHRRWPLASRLRRRRLASLNLGLPDNLKENFPNIIPKIRPRIEFIKILDPH